MSAPDIKGIVEKRLQELKRLQERVLPVKVGKEVTESVRENFRKGGFYGQPWKPPYRRTLGFSGAGGSYGPLLSGTNHLMSSTDYVPGRGNVIIRNNAEYAQVHNEGAEIGVTSKMKRFFWAKFYEAGGGKGGRKAKELQGEAAFWQRMAIKRPGSRIRIPKRLFIGPSPQVDRIVKTIIDKELSKIIK
ncbi:MAG: phage virion morphogenesis protein [Candidatus Cryptobacteroides sp.]